LADTVIPFTPTQESSGASGANSAEDAMADFDVQPSSPGESQFLTRVEVARLFGVSASTVTRWAGGVTPLRGRDF
jgi:hypothetical protein